MGSTACHLALQYPGTISCAGSFHQPLLLLTPVQDTGHKVLSSFRHLINGKNSLHHQKANCKQRTCHGTNTQKATARAGTANGYGTTKKCMGTAPSTPNNQELFLLPTKEFYPPVIGNSQCKLQFGFGNSCDVISPRFSCSPEHGAAHSCNVELQFGHSVTERAQL